MPETYKVKRHIAGSGLEVKTKPGGHLDVLAGGQGVEGALQHLLRGAAAAAALPKLCYDCPQPDLPATK